MGGESGSELANRDAAKSGRAKQVEERRKQDADRQPPSSGVVDGILGAMDTKASKGPPSQAVDPGSHREGQIQGIGRIQDAVFKAVDKGIVRATRMIQPAEMPKNVDGGWLAQILGVAATSTLYGASAAIGAWVAAALTSSKPATSETDSAEATAQPQAPKRSTAGTFIAYAMKDLVRKALSPGSPAAGPDVRDLKEAYIQQLEVEQTAAFSRFSAGWSALHDQLAALSQADLDQALAAAQHMLEAPPADVLNQIADKAILGWTNFLAQASHGAMGGWDFFEKNGSKGALGLKDSADAPERPGQDPTRANVDPKRMDGALQSGQVTGIGEESGVLEIFVDSGGRLLDDPDHRMRLPNVGPDVRKRIAQLGRVGDLPLNKIVRVCSPTTSPATQYASVMIAADGYVRNVNWANLQLMVLHHRALVGPGQIKETHDAMDDMIHGKSSVDAHRATEAENQQIKLIAERAQDLSLAALASS